MNKRNFQCSAGKVNGKPGRGVIKHYRGTARPRNFIGNVFNVLITPFPLNERIAVYEFIAADIGILRLLARVLALLVGFVVYFRAPRKGSAKKSRRED